MTCSQSKSALFQVLGITDEVTACDCCGKSPLKATYAVQMIETGEVLHYGSTCVTRNTGKPMAVVKAEVKSAEEGRVAAAKLEFQRHPEAMALDARFAEAYRRNLPPGREFREFINPGPASEAKAEIARRHGVEVWRI